MLGGAAATIGGRSVDLPDAKNYLAQVAGNVSFCALNNSVFKPSTPEELQMDTPAAVEKAFYAAFEQLDSDLMRSIWSPSDQVYCVHPGGPLLAGPEAVLKSWAQIFAAAAPPLLEQRLLQSRQSGELAINVVEERIRPSGEQSKRSALVIATNVYIAADGGGWRMFAHHASLPMVGAAAPRSRVAVH